MLIHSETRTAQVACPACVDNYTKNLGELKLRNGIFHLNQAGCLYECTTCGLLFRYPYLSAVELEAAYSSLAADAWQYEDRRLDHQLATRIIEDSLPQGRILDIGCFRGDFLNGLASKYQKFGIEMSASARRIAEEKGIAIVSSSIEQLGDTTHSFDAITALDVFEHLPQPLQALQTVAGTLAPGGFLLVSTGNSNTIPWRLSRLDYWYYFPEHVSFFNPKWFRWATQQLTIKLDIIAVKKFSHYPTSVLNRLFRLSQCAAYALVQNLSQSGNLKRLLCSVSPFSRVSQWTSAPGAMHWQDHMLLVLRRAK